jgi:hypothetical protein
MATVRDNVTNSTYLTRAAARVTGYVNFASILLHITAISDQKTIQAMHALTQHWGAFVQPLFKWNSNIYYIFWVYVASGIQHTMHMRHSSRVMCPAIQCFSALSHKRHDFREKEVTEHKNARFGFLYNISHPKNRTRYDHKYNSVLM